MSRKQKAAVFILLIAFNLATPSLVSLASFLLFETSTFNPFWGVGLGIGYEVMAGITGSVTNTPSMIIGGILWPLLFFLGISFGEAALLVKGKRRISLFLWALFVLVNFVNFPVSEEEGTLYQRLPLYSKTQATVY